MRLQFNANLNPADQQKLLNSPAYIAYTQAWPVNNPAKAAIGQKATQKDFLFHLLKLADNPVSTSEELAEQNNILKTENAKLTEKLSAIESEQLPALKLQNTEFSTSLLVERNKSAKLSAKNKELEEFISLLKEFSLFFDESDIKAKLYTEVWKIINERLSAKKNYSAIEVVSDVFVYAFSYMKPDMRKAELFESKVLMQEIYNKVKAKV